MAQREHFRSMFLSLLNQAIYPLNCVSIGREPTQDRLVSRQLLPTRGRHSTSGHYSFLEKTRTWDCFRPSHSGVILRLKAFLSGQFLDK